MSFVSSENTSVPCSDRMEIGGPDADGETTGCVAVGTVAAGEPDPLLLSLVGAPEHAASITRVHAATILRMPDLHLETSGRSSVFSAGALSDLVPLSMRAPIAVDATSSSLTTGCYGRRPNGSNQAGTAKGRRDRTWQLEP
jgi:hypothetical protein